MVEHSVVEGELAGVVEDECQDDHGKRVAEEGQHPEEDTLEEDPDYLEQHDPSEADEDLVGLGDDVRVPGVQFNIDLEFRVDKFGTTSGKTSVLGKLMFRYVSEL